MSRVILQVPMSADLKTAAEMTAKDYGFSSLQETIRLILHKLVKRELVISVGEPEEIKLSPKAEKRYIKMIQDINKGKKVTKTKNLEEFFSLLG